VVLDVKIQWLHLANDNHSYTSVITCQEITPRRQCYSEPKTDFSL